MRSDARTIGPTIGRAIRRPPGAAALAGVSPEAAPPAWCRLDAGEALFELGDAACVWQLEAGVIRLDQAGRDGSVAFTQIALPGDLLGLESLAAFNHRQAARAIVPCVLRRRVLAGDAERRLAMLEGLMQAQQRCADVVALRTGPAQDRLKRLLVLLASAESDGGDGEWVLPTIRDMAVMIDTSPETVSRILANLKRSHILEGRSRQGARFSLSRLRDADWPAGMTRSDGSLRLGQVAA